MFANFSSKRSCRYSLVFSCISQIFRKLFCKKKVILHELSKENVHLVWLLHSLKMKRLNSCYRFCSPTDEVMSGSVPSC